MTFAKLMDLHPFSLHLEQISVMKLTQPREVHLIISPLWVRTSYMEAP